MKKLICFLPGVIMLFAIASCIGNKSAHNYNNNIAIDTGEQAFIKQGLEAGQTEIKASKVAETTSKNPRIIRFAKMMIADHDRAGDDLEKIAINNRVRGGDSVSTAHQIMITNLASLSGDTFDKAYIQMMVTDHQEAVKLFTAGTTDNNAELQNFAKKTLPVLKMHLDSANAICASLK